MKKRKMHIAICMLASVILSHADGPHTEGGLQIIRCDVNHTQNVLDVTFTADLDSLQVGTDDEWEIQPLIVTSADTFALPAKQQILANITETSGPDHRDVLICQIDGGATYCKLLDDFYLPLRRVVCETRYTIVPSTAHQGKKILVTYPD